MKRFRGLWRVWLFIAVVCVPMSMFAGEKFSFVQITDTHWGPLYHNWRTMEIVEQINKLSIDIDFVAHTGDFSQNDFDNKIYHKEQYDVLKKLNKPMYAVPGNHDILPWKIDSTMEFYEKSYGKIAYTVKNKGVVMVYSFLTPIEKNFKIKNYDPMKQLETMLEKNKKSPMIIFCHIPVAKDFYNNEEHDPWGAEFRAKFTKLINKYDVKAVICGHYHRGELHWLGKVPLYVSPSIAGYWERQASYRIYDYVDGRLSYRTVYIEDKKLRKKYKKQKKKDKDD